MVNWHDMDGKKAPAFTSTEFLTNAQNEPEQIEWRVMNIKIGANIFEAVSRENVSSILVCISLFMHTYAHL